MQSLTQYDIQRRNELREQADRNVLSEDMKPYLEFLEGNRKRTRGEWYKKLRGLIRNSGKNDEELSELITRNLSRQCINRVRMGDRGIISEGTAKSIFYRMRKRLKKP